jgi:conjugative coupling factor TraD (TOL family)
MSNQPIEALLRPAVEFSSVVTYLSLAVMAIGAPQIFLLPGGVGYVIGGAFLLRAAVLGRQGARLLRYQRGLRALPAYVTHPNKIPRSPMKLTLGRGFEWTAKQAQRLADTKRSENAHLFNDTWIYGSARRLIDSTGKALGKWAVAPLNSQSLLNPFPPHPYVEGSSELHAVGLYEKEMPIALRQAERVAHTLVVGTTRVGKTRLLEVLVTQDIHNGDSVVVFDPKGDGDLLARIYMEAKRAGRSDDLQIFNLGFPEESVLYNPVGTYSRITEVASRIAGQLPNEGNSAAFKDFAWRFVNVIAKACDALGIVPNYKVLLEKGGDIDRLLSDYIRHLLAANDFEGVEDAIEALVSSERKMPPQLKGRDRDAWACSVLFRESQINDSTAHSLIKTFEHDKTHFDKLVASLFPLLEKLTSGRAAELLSPDEANKDDKLNWNRVIKSGGIVYVGLDALSDPDVAAAVGNAMFSDLTSVAGSIYKAAQSGIETKKLCVHADEFNELVGREFIPMANKAGGAGFQLTVYTQTLSDIIARFDSPAKAGQVIGNLGTLIMLRVKEKATAELLTERLKEVEINHLMTESGTTDSSNPDNDIHFVSNTRQRITSQRVRLLDAGDLDALPKGHAFALMAGKLYKLRLPLLSDEQELPSGMMSMVENMRQIQKGVNPDSWLAQTPLVVVGDNGE